MFAGIWLYGYFFLVTVNMYNMILIHGCTISSNGHLFLRLGSEQCFPFFPRQAKDLKLS